MRKARFIITGRGKPQDIPVITKATPTISLPFTNGEIIQQMSATNSPTSWAITAVSGDSATTSDFAIAIPNYITNNTMVGALAPTTLPTGWESEDRALGVAAAGVTATVIGSGVDGNGRNYIDVKWTGTATGVMHWGIFPTHPFQIGDTGVPRPNNAAPAAPGQTWTASMWLSVVGGSTANLGTCYVGINSYDVNGNWLSTPGYNNILSTINSTSTRVSCTATNIADATCTQVACSFAVTYTSGAINITVRCAWPQLEKGSVANTPVLTPPSSSIITATSNAVNGITTAGTVVITVTATNAGGISNPGTCTVTVNAAVAAFTPAAGALGLAPTTPTVVNSGVTDPWINLDGRTNAPGDTGNALYTYYANPNSIATPQANPLAKYHAAGHADARVLLGTDANYYQPPWQVAGIDYPVGIRPAYLPLKTPTSGNMPAGASLSGSQITISASNVTLQGFDLSTGTGINVYANSGSYTNIIISDCYFKTTGNATDLIDGSNSQVTVQYCVVDNNGISTNTSAAINRIWKFQYSLVMNAEQDTFNYGAGQPGGLSATQQGFFASFSVVLNGGTGNSHADFYQEGGPVGGGLPWNPNANFMFFWEQGAGAPAIGNPSGQGTQGWMLEPNGGATIIGSMTNCTAITAKVTGGGSPINFIAGADNEGSAGGVIVSPGVAFQNNFFDLTGAGSFRLTSIGTGNPYVQVNLNTSMLNGLQDAAAGFNHYP